MNFKRPEKKELITLMAAGCLIGILCFALVYGFDIVRFTYDDWLFFGDMDLKQHYNGFCHFRLSPWRFPIGLIDSLSVPYSMSVVYTDSIPLFAVIFKLFSGVLPVKFQYFGLFGLLCFAMMGMLSPVLIRRFTDSKIVCIAGSLFFILSYPVLHRMFYHTALSAQWIIVLALIVWFYTDITDKNQTKKLCVYWALIGLLSVSIHSYFVFMTAIILMAQVVEGYVRAALAYKTATISEKEDLGKKDGLIKLIISNIHIIFPLISLGSFTFILLYILGGFYGSGSVSGDGFGSFNGNLSTYVNPMSFSTIFKGFELNGPFEFEGFAYVGIGVMALLCIMLLYYAFIKRDIIYRIKNLSLRKKVIFFTIIFVVLISCFPKYSFGSIKLISVPVPRIVQRLLGICRTNARFVWVGMYLIITAAIYYVGKSFDKVWVKIIFALAIVLQIFELSGTVKAYQSKYSEHKEYVTLWEELEDEHITDGKSQFVFMYDENDIMMDTAYYAYLKGMSQNSFYYARTIYDEIDFTIEEWSDSFLNGDIDGSVIYIFRDGDYTDKYKEIVRSTGAKEYSLKGHVIVVK